jgi:hypothetical protein
MKILKRLLASVLVLAGAAMLCAPSRADAFNKRTKLTFSHPVEVPGLILTPGTYTFKLLNVQGSRNVVQIFNEDETRLLTTILAISDYRLTPADKTVIEFREQPAGSPIALRSWFYPGDNYGRQFVYPKKRAIELAKAEQAPVPAEALEVPVSELETVPLVAVTPEAREEPLAQAFETTAPAEPTLLAQVIPGEKSLPKTASQIPMFALVGATLLVLGLGIKLILAKRNA